MWGGQLGRHCSKWPSERQWSKMDHLDHEGMNEECPWETEWIEWLQSWTGHRVREEVASMTSAHAAGWRQILH